MKVKRMTYLDDALIKKVEAIKAYTGKSVSNLIAEGLSDVIAKYETRPKTLAEAIARTAGIAAKYGIKVKNMRKELNADFERRAKRFEKALKKGRLVKYDD
jgi:hypothetical protein